MPVLSLEPGHEPYVESGIELCTQKLWYLLRDFHFLVRNDVLGLPLYIAKQPKLSKEFVPVQYSFEINMLSAKEELPINSSNHVGIPDVCT